MDKRFLYESETRGYDAVPGHQKKISIFAVISLFFMGMVGIILYAPTATYQNQNKINSLIQKSDYVSDISFTLGRVGYKTIPYFNSNIKVQPKYKILENFIAVIEPYASMELRIYNDELLSVSNYKFLFEVCPTDKDSSECQESTKYKSISGDEVSGEIKFACSPYELFDINIYELDEDSKEVRSHITGKGICQYVRREIRALSDADLTNFAQVSYKLWEVNQEDGKALYGDKYHSAGYLLKLHHFNAAQIDADHIHEGNGFLLQHAKITNIFENSLKAVDPSVYLPYWDYTIDDANKHSVMDSVIMTDKLYGRMFIPENIEKGFSYEYDKIKDGRIIDGLWADLKADMNEDFPTLKAGYGYMRAPWSMNPSPYISRFTTVYDRNIMLPSCQMHYDSLISYDVIQ